MAGHEHAPARVGAAEVGGDHGSLYPRSPRFCRGARTPSYLDMIFPRDRTGRPLSHRFHWMKR
jgi:hypothetical protein